MVQHEREQVLQMIDLCWGMRSGRTGHMDSTPTTSLFTDTVVIRYELIQ